MNKKNNTTQQTNMISPAGISCFVVLFFLCLIICPVNVFAELTALSKSEMKEVTGQQGMTDYSVEGNIARLFVDVHIETAGTIDSVKAGHYNGGWDNDFTGITIASDADPLKVDGLVFIADFDDINSQNRNLQTVVMGTNRIQGSVSATMNSYTGVYNDALTGGSGNPVYCSRTNLGNTTFNFDSNISETENMGFFMIYTFDGVNPGVKFVSGYDENSIASSFSAGEWWDAP